MAPKELEIAGLFGSSTSTELLDERSRKEVRAKTAASQKLKSRNALRGAQERRKVLTDEINSKKTRNEKSLRDVSGDSKSKIDVCLIDTKNLHEADKNAVDFGNQHTPIRKLPPEQRKAYFAQKKRESDQRILSTEEGRIKRNEAMRPINRKYYNNVMADPQKRSAYKERSALNEKARQSRNLLARPKAPSSSAKTEPNPV